MEKISSHGSKEIHLSLVISGAVSLGSYEAGALVKLLGAVKESQKPGYQGSKLIIDVIAGASAGAMTGAMVAYCLLYGVREEILYDVWVDETDIKRLLNSFGRGSILSSRQIREIAHKYLKNPQYLPLELLDKSSIQKSPIRLAISLTNLNGRNFSIPIDYPNNKKEDFQVFTFKDGRYYDLMPSEDGWNKELNGTWEDIRNAAVASGAFPVAFEPVELKNRRDKNLSPESMKKSFYTDGGVLNNKPLGIAIDSTFSPKSLGTPDNTQKPLDLDRSSERYFILLQPEAGQVSASMDKKAFTPFEVGINAIFSMPLHQSIYEDIMKIQRLNTHLKWNEEFLSDLGKTIYSLGEDRVDELITIIKNKCRDILSIKKDIALKNQKDGESIYSLENQIELSGAKKEEPEIVKYLRLYINLVGRLRGKGKINVYVIRPTEKVGQEKDILAGEFVMHFGGVLSKKLRKHDFVTGYRNAQEWLAKMGFNNLVSNEVKIYSVKKKKELVLDYDARLGGISFKNLAYLERLRACLTGVKAVEVIFYSFAKNHPKFQKLLNMFIGFLTLLAYPLALIGGGVWIIIAFLVFFIGIFHSFEYLKLFLEFIKNLF